MSEASQAARVPAPSEASAAPAEFDCDVTTQLGTKIHVRAIRPDDSERLAAFHEALSARSVYMRFFSVHPRLSEREVERFTHVDYSERLALIAEISGQLVAVARYDRLLPSSEAEVAFVVADDWQHHGIASSLLELLARAAWLCGIDTFTASTLAENKEMLHVFTHSPFEVTTRFDGGVVEVRFGIAPGYHRSVAASEAPESSSCAERRTDAGR